MWKGLKIPKSVFEPDLISKIEGKLVFFTKFKVRIDDEINEYIHI